MADQSSNSITIDASASEICEVLTNLEQYPSWSSAIKNVEIQERDNAGRAVKVTISIEAGVLKDRASLTYDWSKSPEEICFSLDEANMMTEMTGCYLIKDNGDDTTTVTYALSTQVAMPVPDMMRRKVEMQTIDTALSQLKKKMEG